MRWHHLGGSPVVLVADIHVFNETHSVRSAAEIFDQIQDGMVIDPPLNNGIDLDGAKPSFLRCMNALQNVLDLSPLSAHLPENIFIQRIQTYGQTAESGRFQTRGPIGQHRTVRGQRQIVDAFNSR